MLDIFLKTLPFFALIGLGYGAGRTRFFTEEATAYLTKFVFYFALSAMIFRFAANLSLAEVVDTRFILAYLWGSGFVYGMVMAVAYLRKRSAEEAAIEAQCGVIGNTGFLGIPMLALLLGEAAVAPVMMVLAMDLIVFGSLIVILVTAGRDGRAGLAVLGTVTIGLLKNPMIMSMALGLAWSASNLQMPAPAEEFLSILGAAATPGALFAIGASLATKSAERMVVAGWLSFAKLVLHPAFVALAALYIFPLDPFPAAVMISCAALPVAGNIYILAQHYGVAPHRVSAAILFSTVVSVGTVPVVIAWVTTLY
ncbi:AEC family transporter [Alisedimentitalea sp. MJ-SS2]|uniref:AEC family transporter n=1 Tax=Aliisedimentitalea sp. MJ-SS2 TaxID=3049795 RepID=UPI00291245C0|nr:AEC family transporter [Alisedimentitalea sp. MJ-SS2]MDU8929383.1 AEC family transporter [Alisedimentitalea sp. MJ-SS2]